MLQAESFLTKRSLQHVAETLVDMLETLPTIQPIRILHRRLNRAPVDRWIVGEKAIEAAFHRCVHFSETAWFASLGRIVYAAQAPDRSQPVVLMAAQIRARIGTTQAAQIGETEIVAEPAMGKHATRFVVYEKMTSG